MTVYAVMSHEEHRAYRCDGDGNAEIIGVFRDFNQALEAAKSAFDEIKKGLEAYGESFDEDDEIKSDDFWNCCESDIDEYGKQWYAEVDGEAIEIEIEIKKFNI